MDKKLRVEIGRVGFVNYGEQYGKVCVIIDILDNNRVLVDGPVEFTGMRRQTYPLRRLGLTPIVAKIPRCPRHSTLAAAFKDQKVLDQWQQTAVYRKMQRRFKRENMSDFDRFKLMIARKERSKIIRKELAALKAKAS